MTSRALLYLLISTQLFFQSNGYIIPSTRSSLLKHSALSSPSQKCRASPSLSKKSLPITWTNKKLAPLQMSDLDDSSGGEDFRFGVGGAVASTFAAVALYLSAPASAVTASNAAPAITTDSTEQSLVVAKSLSDLNARMYGAFWCSHCYDQKQAFGKEAFQKYISYIECDKEGLNNQRSLCKEKDVPGYPTWEINGKLYPGERSLEELQELLGEIVNK
mmetsp:Transcript_38758/g.47225  ORF Transcript_38758/g.47225 Transcript_38758/m.47225 type:complete len:218 (-) Transcript_38758:145-798(-)